MGNYLSTNEFKCALDLLNRSKTKNMSLKLYTEKNVARTKIIRHEDFEKTKLFILSHNN